MRVHQQRGLPMWYDMPGRFLYSSNYDDLPRQVLDYFVKAAEVVSVDTEVSRSDWADVRQDILLVPQGSRDWSASSLDHTVQREHVYYVGSVNRAVDVGLIASLARSLGKPIRVIGVDESDALRSSADIEGWKPAHQIPGAMSDGIAGIVPYLINDFTAGVLPTKVYDYWLAGMPAITTPLPSLAGEPDAWVCHSAEEMMKAISRARALTPAERLAIRDRARAHGWAKRFEPIAKRLGLER